MGIMHSLKLAGCSSWRPSSKILIICSLTLTFQWKINGKSFTDDPLLRWVRLLDFCPNAFNHIWKSLQKALKKHNSRDRDENQSFSALWFCSLPLPHLKNSEKLHLSSYPSRVLKYLVAKALVISMRMSMPVPINFEFFIKLLLKVGRRLKQGDLAQPVY